MNWSTPIIGKRWEILHGAVFRNNTENLSLEPHFTGSPARTTKWPFEEVYFLAVMFRTTPRKNKLLLPADTLRTCWLLTCTGSPLRWCHHPRQGSGRSSSFPPWSRGTPQRRRYLPARPDALSDRRQRHAWSPPG